MYTGLSAVIECCSDGQVSFYLCVSCGSKIEKALLISHVLKYRHRQLYLVRHTHVHTSYSTIHTILTEIVIVEQ